MRIRVYHEDGTVVLVAQAIGTGNRALPVQYLTSGDQRIYDVDAGGRITLMFLGAAVPSGNADHGLAPTPAPDVWIGPWRGTVHLKAPDGSKVKVPADGGWFRILLGQPFDAIVEEDWAVPE